MEALVDVVDNITVINLRNGITVSVVLLDPRWLEGGGPLDGP